MFFSVSNAFEKKRIELNQIVNLNTPLTSEEALYHSQQLDHFVTLYQNQKRSELDISENLEESTLTINIKGQLDIVTSEYLTSYIEMNKQKWEQHKELYVNLLELKFFDTLGIRSLLLLILEAKNNNLLIKINNISKAAYEIFNIMGVSKYLDKMNCEIIKI
ncbi:STAS domain-containing protein [Bacillus songklensis]|uniref:STAS domain-containing protein n=1 Tax=Bacillus songklensis TaxID=1069116 RepID=A0ABV8B8I1_9BACI